MNQKCYRNCEEVHSGVGVTLPARLRRSISKGASLGPDKVTKKNLFNFRLIYYFYVSINLIE
jgi:hypothetical protein